MIPKRFTDTAGRRVEAISWGRTVSDCRRAIMFFRRTDSTSTYVVFRDRARRVSPWVVGRVLSTPTGGETE